MFGNAYQNGHYFEVWDSKASHDKNEAYKHLVRVSPPSNKQFFDKDVKSYIYALEGQNTKIILPASDQKELSLHQKYLVLHLFLPIGSPWSMELGITDINGIKRRINFTTVQGKPEVKFFSVRYPLDNLQRGTWLFLAFNVYSFIDIFKGQVYRSLDHIMVGSNCKIRRIFTMKQWEQWEIPKSFWLNSEIPQQFQLIQYRELSLPKISVPKGIANQQSSPPQIDKQGSIKHSKSNLARSQVIQKNSQRGGVITHSPVKAIMNKIEALQKQKDKYAVNSKSNIINQSKIRQLSKIDDMSSKKSEIGLSQKNGQNKQSHEKQIQEKVKNSPKKSPMIEKSFRQDEALNYKPDEDSEVNFETSNESFVHKSVRNSKKYEKWQKMEVGKSKSKIIQNENPAVPLSTVAVSNRTVLTKENEKSKLKIGEKATQLELIYDEMVGCYYHPETHTYYEIKQ